MSSLRRPFVVAALVILMSSIVLATVASEPGSATSPANLGSGTPGGILKQPTQGLALELIEQDFSFGPDGTLHLVYRLIGDVRESAELTETTTTTTTTTSSTVPATTSTTLPTPTTSLGESAPDAPVPATTTPPPTSTTLPPPPPPVQLTIEVTNYEPLRTTTAVDQVVGSNVNPSAFTNVIDGVAIDDLRDRVKFSPNGTATFTLDIETDVIDSVEEKLKFDRPGLYPVRVELLIGDPSDDQVLATAGTIVQRLPGPDDPTPATTGISVPATDAPPINLAVATATPSVGPSAGNVEKRSADVALNNAIDLAATITSSVTLEVPPPLIAGRAENPAEQQQLAIDLADDEFVALPLAPLDVSSAVAVGLSDTYARLLAAGEDLLTAAVPSTPSRRDIWLAKDPLSAAGAQALRDLGVRFVVMPGELYRETVGPRLPESDQFVDIQLPDGGTLPLLIVDDLSAELTTAATDQVLARATPTEWAVETTAKMLIDQAQREQQGQLNPNDESEPPGQSTNLSRVLSTPDLHAPDPRLLIGLEELAATTPGVQFVPGSSLTGVTDTQTVAGQPVTVELPETAGPSLSNRIELIDSTRLQMLSAASMLAEDDERLAAWTAELDALVSTGYTDTDVEAAADALLDEANELKRSIHLPEPFTFTMTGRSGTIEIRMHNDLDEPLDVLLQFSSPKVNFPQGDRIVTLRANGETSVIVPVEARSNGTSSIDVQASTPAGEVLTEPITLTSRVTALTGLGQVLTVGFILVLLTWWFTHWRSKRRAALVDDGRDRHPTSKQ